VTSAELAARATALFGEQWQTALARKARIAPRTVRHWALGDRAIPDWLEVLFDAWEALGSGP